jgi:hypothetical protein
MGVESKLCHIADETTDCCQIETGFVLSTRDGIGRRRRLVWPKPTATILARRFNPAAFSRLWTGAQQANTTARGSRKPGRGHPADNPAAGY